MVKYMQKEELIEEIKKSPIRYAYTEMFLLKKNFYFHKETFCVSNYPVFIEKLLEFLLEKALEKEINTQPTRFYNATSDRDKVFRNISIDIFYKEFDHLKIESFKLLDIAFMFEEVNRLHIKKIKNKLNRDKKKIKRENIFVLMRFNKKEEPFGIITRDEINYWNNFTSRSDYRYFHSFIKTRKIDVLKKYSTQELEKNIRLNAMCLNGEILFFKKLIEKELLIDAAKYINENYIRKGFDILNNNADKTSSVLNMLKTLDIKTLKIMEEDCLIYSLLNQKEWVDFYIEKAEIDWKTKQMEEKNNGYNTKMFLNQSKEYTQDRISYLQNINLLINENMGEVVNYLIVNELDEEIDKYIEVICTNDMVTEVPQVKKERFILLNESLNKLLTYKLKKGLNCIFDFNIIKMIANHKVAEIMFKQRIDDIFHGIEKYIKNIHVSDSSIVEEFDISFYREISPFSFLLLEEMWEKVFFHYGLCILNLVLNNKLDEIDRIDFSHYNNSVTELEDVIVIKIKNKDHAIANLECAKMICYKIFDIVFNNKREIFETLLNENSIKANKFSFFLMTVGRLSLFGENQKDVGGNSYTYLEGSKGYFGILHERFNTTIRECVLTHTISHRCDIDKKVITNKFTENKRKKI